MTKTKALVLCSGGVDSTTLLARAVSKYGAENVYAFSISYGQKHVREIEAARAVAAHYGVEQRFLDLGAIVADSDCSLLAHSDAAIPESSYADQQAEGDGGPVSTYVPFRNGLFLSSAASMALSLGCSTVYYGAHHDDWAGKAYPDCSLEFVAAMNRAIVEGTGGELCLDCLLYTSFLIRLFIWACFAPASTGRRSWPRTACSPRSWASRSSFPCSCRASVGSRRSMPASCSCRLR